jgi:acetyl-CoA synthetase
MVRGGGVKALLQVLGAWLCGAVASVADPGLAPAALRDQLEDTGAKVVVTTAQHAAAFLLAAAQLPEGARPGHILLLDAGPGQEQCPPGTRSFHPLLSGPPGAPDLGRWAPELPAVVHWSSGTTGRPKGILHCQAYLHTMLKPSKLPRGTVSLSSNILFHQGAFLLPFDGGIFNRFTCCFIREEDFSPRVALDSIARHRAQFYMCGLNHFTAISNQAAEGRDLSSMVCIMPAGGGVSGEAVARMHGLFPSLAFVYVFYGSSEVSGVSYALKPGTLGSLLPGVQVPAPPLHLTRPRSTSGTGAQGRAWGPARGARLWRGHPL